MSGLNPVSRRALIADLKKFGFDGPHRGGRHQFMIKGAVRLTLPNPHRGEIGADLLDRLLKQAGIGRDAWLKKK
ncbi:MAG: type II toxin-antitoxin system HicA family toxin [Nitrospiraceae bacterium]|nr:type II toxin-antitoxin system HicA family toxin [Nitrospiraceae bacterium]